MKRIFILILILISISCIIFYNFINKDNEKMNEAVTYSLSISKNGEVINDNIIELNNNNNNIEFDIKFSADKDKYIEDFDLYNLYVMVNFKEIDFLLIIIIVIIFIVFN